MRYVGWAVPELVFCYYNTHVRVSHLVLQVGDAGKAMHTMRMAMVQAEERLRLLSTDCLDKPSLGTIKKCLDTMDNGLEQDWVEDPAYAEFLASVKVMHQKLRAVHTFLQALWPERPEEGTEAASEEVDPMLAYYDKTVAAGVSITKWKVQQILLLRFLTFVMDEGSAEDAANVCSARHVEGVKTLHDVDPSARASVQCTLINHVVSTWSADASKESALVDFIIAVQRSEIHDTDLGQFIGDIILLANASPADSDCVALANAFQRGSKKGCSLYKFLKSACGASIMASATAAQATILGNAAAIQEFDTLKESMPPPFLKLDVVHAIGEAYGDKVLLPKMSQWKTFCKGLIAAKSKASQELLDSCQGRFDDILLRQSEAANTITLAAHTYVLTKIGEQAVMLDSLVSSLATGVPPRFENKVKDCSSALKAIRIPSREMLSLSVFGDMGAALEDKMREVHNMINLMRETCELALLRSQGHELQLLATRKNYLTSLSSFTPSDAIDEECVAFQNFMKSTKGVMSSLVFDEISEKFAAWCGISSFGTWLDDIVSGKEEHDWTTTHAAEKTPACAVLEAAVISICVDMTSESSFFSLWSSASMPSLVLPDGHGKDLILGGTCILARLYKHHLAVVQECKRLEDWHQHVQGLNACLTEITECRGHVSKWSNISQGMLKSCKLDNIFDKLNTLVEAKSKLIVQSWVAAVEKRCCYC